MLVQLCCKLICYYSSSENGDTWSSYRSTNDNVKLVNKYQGGCLILGYVIVSVRQHDVWNCPKNPEISA